MPGCEVSFNGDAADSLGDEKQVTYEVERGSYMVSVRKAGYEPFSKSVKVSCNETEKIEARLARRSVAVRLRTNLPGCEIYVGSPPALQGRSDDEGLFSYATSATQLLVEARKPGYQSAVEAFAVTTDLEKREVRLNLKPVPATLDVTANVEGARIGFVGREESYAAGEPFTLAPGTHRMTVGALGYAPREIEVKASPNETIKRTVELERLPVAELLAQAERFLSQRAYAEASTLARYVFETDAGNAHAHRIEGLTHLARGDYAKAEQSLQRALAGGASVRLQVRRHAGENFDPLKGHDACAAALILSKSELEFQGLQSPAENFKVPYASVAAAGVQLKKNAYVYLGAKVETARGKRKDYNFYGYDKELSQASAAYLRMIQNLLRAH